MGVSSQASRPLAARTRRAAGQFGDHLRTFRKLQGLTAEQVAERANISRNSLRQIETGGTGVSFGNVLEVCRVLGVLDFVLDGMNPYETALGQALARKNLELPKRVRQ